MSNANKTTATTIDTTPMGIQEFQAAIIDGTLTAQQVLDVLDARIAKRKANNKPLIAKVVAYRNDLAASLSQATGAAIPAVPVPTYATANKALPTDPAELADVVFSTVGAAGIGQVITRLTARMIGA